MKLMFASDIHGSLPATERVLERFAQSGARWLIILGDVLNHGPRNALPEGYAPGEVAERLNSVAERIVAVRGNCDSEVDQMLLEFPMMSDYSVLYFAGRKIFLSHGHSFAPDSLPPLPDGSIFISGHTHIPLLEMRGGIIVLNPGSTTIPKGGSEAGYAVIEETVIMIKTIEGAVIREMKL